MTSERDDFSQLRRPAARRSTDRFLVMMSRHREFLHKQRGFLAEKLRFVEDELRNIEDFLGRADSEVMSAASQGMATGSSRVRSADQRTIKSYIFEFLSDQEEGLTAKEILERLHAGGRMDYDLLHLRAYLYRLGILGHLMRKGKRWLMVSSFNGLAADPGQVVSGAAE